MKLVGCIQDHLTSRVNFLIVKREIWCRCIEWDWRCVLQWSICVNPLDIFSDARSELGGSCSWHFEQPMSTGLYDWIPHLYAGRGRLYDVSLVSASCGRAIQRSSSWERQPWFVTAVPYSQKLRPKRPLKATAHEQTWVMRTTVAELLAN